MSTIEIVMSSVAGLESILVAILLGIKFKDYRSQEKFVRELVREEISKAISEYDKARNHNVITSGAEVFFEGCHETILQEHLQALREAATSHAPLAIETCLRNLKSYLLREKVDWQALPADMRKDYIDILCRIQGSLASDILDLIRCS